MSVSYVQVFMHEFLIFSYVKQDYRLVGAVIAEYRMPLEGCEDACLSEPECKSFNSKNNICELSKKTISDTTDNCTISDASLTQGQLRKVKHCMLYKQKKWIFKSTDYTTSLVSPCLLYRIFCKGTKIYAIMVIRH